MKYIFTLILAMVFFKMDAQNLQFSQVLTLTGQVNVIDQSFLIGTVPQGKVWKIESLNDFGSTSLLFEINGVRITSGNSSYPAHFPIWLKSDDALYCYKSGAGVQPKYFVSIIEFTLVP